VFFFSAASSARSRRRRVGVGQHAPGFRRRPRSSVEGPAPLDLLRQRLRKAGALPETAAPGGDRGAEERASPVGAPEPRSSGLRRRSPSSSITSPPRRGAIFAGERNTPRGCPGLGIGVDQQGIGPLDGRSKRRESAGLVQLDASEGFDHQKGVEGGRAARCRDPGGNTVCSSGRSGKLARTLLNGRKSGAGRQRALVEESHSNARFSGSALALHGDKRARWRGIVVPGAKRERRVVKVTGPRGRPSSALSCGKERALSGWFVICNSAEDRSPSPIFRKVWGPGRPGDGPFVKDEEGGILEPARTFGPYTRFPVALL